MYSKKIAPYYDLLMGDYSSLIHKTEQLLNRYVQKNNAVLELSRIQKGKLSINTEKIRLDAEQEIYSRLLKRHIVFQA